MNHWPELVPVELARLRILRVRFHLRAAAAGSLPPYLGSTLRGALAMAMRRLVCTHGMRPCDGCPVQRSCPYPDTFETPAASGSQEIKRMRDLPHPLVIEPPLHHPQSYRPGDLLPFDINLFGSAFTRLPYLVFAVKEMGLEGLGEKRIPFSLVSVTDRSGAALYDETTGILAAERPMVTIAELLDANIPGETVKLRLETPLRLKSQGTLQSRRLDIGMFCATVCRRLWAILTRFESADPEKVDFRPLLHADGYPVIESARLQWRDLTRYSNRQNTSLKMGGLVGSISLVSVTAPWRPLLTAATAVHVGKSTIMGLGKIVMDS
ncbi:MAG: CRISPR system precrRNA processing endoribonuclease RAMP protein Cas6 [Candidatus Omnitrophota bacterium]|jgi:hypothetical protein|nr:MAG: CRISPR system precrRNA processing endoribonuclease RAMP protein Cas6 [Candidatus Omnitrophota bacterium]